MRARSVTYNDNETLSENDRGEAMDNEALSENDRGEAIDTYQLSRCRIVSRSGLGNRRTRYRRHRCRPRKRPAKRFEEADERSRLCCAEGVGERTARGPPMQLERQVVERRLQVAQQTANLQLAKIGCVIWGRSEREPHEPRRRRGHVPTGDDMAVAVYAVGCNFTNGFARRLRFCRSHHAKGALW